MSCAIEAENLHKAYGSIKALDGVSIQVDPGEIFGFLGPNGAGKSTFVKIILNLVSPNQGFARILGRDVKKASARRQLGFLPENICFYPFLTIQEMMRYNAELAGISRVLIAEEIRRCLDIVGLEADSKRRIGTLSKGMKQRAGIAQAILGRPEIVLMDEPTSGLDPIGIKELRGLLEDLKRQGTTVFLNSHLLSEVERTCDKVAILNKGRVIRSGASADLAGKVRHLEVRADGITQTAVQEINALSREPAQLESGGLRAFPGSEEDAVEIHQVIVRNGGRVHAFAWKGESLEELFYRLVKNENVDNC